MAKKDNQKTKIIIGLKKARTSLDKIIQALEVDAGGTEKKCFDIIQQNLAVIGLLKAANISMLKNHLEMYTQKVNKGKAQKKDLDKMKGEIIKIVQMAQRK
ncbi:MAG TPA: metal-sensing transcriptional repressor [Candidatus Pacebacteria bacterium]|nr:metal-sensing transcriptional repressor [Candidatus Paceibacterota bacterium]